MSEHQQEPLVAAINAMINAQTASGIQAAQAAARESKLIVEQMSNTLKLQQAENAKQITAQIQGAIKPMSDAIASIEKLVAEQKTAQNALIQAGLNECKAQVKKIVSYLKAISE